MTKVIDRVIVTDEEVTVLDRLRRLRTPRSVSELYKAGEPLRKGLNAAQGRWLVLRVLLSLEQRGLVERVYPGKGEIVWSRVCGG